MDASDALKQVAFTVADTFEGTASSDVKRLHAKGTGNFADVGDVRPKARPRVQGLETDVRC